jgi:hypothetical protein
MDNSFWDNYCPKELVIAAAKRALLRSNNALPAVTPGARLPWRMRIEKRSASSGGAVAESETTRAEDVAERYSLQ